MSEQANAADSKLWEITNICEYVNQTNGMVAIVNRKDANDNITIDPLNSKFEEIHVPWANSQVEFINNKQHIEITVSAGNKKYYIWQHGEKVRFSTNGTWSENAYAVPGYANAGGLRKLFIRADGSLYLEVR